MGRPAELDAEQQITSPRTEQRRLVGAGPAPTNQPLRRNPVDGWRNNTRRTSGSTPFQIAPPFGPRQQPSELTLEQRPTTR